MTLTKFPKKNPAVRHLAPFHHSIPPKRAVLVVDVEVYPCLTDMSTTFRFEVGYPPKSPYSPLRFFRP